MLVIVAIAAALIGAAAGALTVAAIVTGRIAELEQRVADTERSTRLLAGAVELSDALRRAEQ